jgi:hypothetical protein
MATDLAATRATPADSWARSNNSSNHLLEEQEAPPVTSTPTRIRSNFSPQQSNHHVGTSPSLSTPRYALPLRAFPTPPGRSTHQTPSSPLGCSPSAHIYQGSWSLKPRDATQPSVATVHAPTAQDSEDHQSPVPSAHSEPQACSPASCHDHQAMIREDSSCQVHSTEFHNATAPPHVEGNNVDSGVAMPGRFHLSGIVPPKSRLHLWDRDALSDTVSVLTLVRHRPFK